MMNENPRLVSTLAPLLFLLVIYRGLGTLSMLLSRGRYAASILSANNEAMSAHSVLSVMYQEGGDVQRCLLQG